jgi:hypothetical protein
MMFSWRESPEIVVQVSLAIILVEVVLLAIGLDLAPIGVQPAMFGSP